MEQVAIHQQQILWQEHWSNSLNLNLISVPLLRLSLMCSTFTTQSHVTFNTNTCTKEIMTLDTHYGQVRQNLLH